MLKIAENLWAVGPTLGAHNAHPDLLAGGKRGCCPLPKNPTPPAAFGRGPQWKIVDTPVYYIPC